MSESDVTVEEIAAALEALEMKWEGRIAEAQTVIQKLRIGDPNHSYYRGMIEGYKAALKDLRALLHEPAEAPSAENVESYALVDRDRMLALLERAGLSINELHAHKDNTFSAVFPPLQVLSFQERIAKLEIVGDVVILDTGRLPNSSKTYIDFAFKTPPG
ncbi:MAG: hypothetical protein K8I30_18640 [Anaerolineae bacterium]|nr:hypothetical protein [Anaerolineae bacterium]